MYTVLNLNTELCGGSGDGGGGGGDGGGGGGGGRRRRVLGWWAEWVGRSPDVIKIRTRNGWWLALRG